MRNKVHYAKLTEALIAQEVVAVAELLAEAVHLATRIMNKPAEVIVGA